MEKRIPVLFLLIIFVLSLLTVTSAESSSYELWGETILPGDTCVSFNPHKVGPISELCALLDAVPSLTRVEMSNAALTRQDRDTLFFAYPDVDFIWSIKINESHTILTDMTAYSAWGKVPHLNVRNMWNFVYCKQLKFLDFGHMTIQNIEFLRHCSKLKALIAVDACIRDISALEDQNEIEYLELFLNSITDISPLAGMTNLMDVNLAFNDIRDLSPLWELPNLQRVWLMGNKHLPAEQVEQLRLHQPDCEIVTRSWGSTGDQLDENGKEIPHTSWRDHPHYNVIYAMSYGGGAHDYLPWDADVQPVKLINGYFQ